MSLDENRSFQQGIQGGCQSGNAIIWLSFIKENPIMATIFLCVFFLLLFFYKCQSNFKLDSFKSVHLQIYCLYLLSLMLQSIIRNLP